jgi:pimeloyl-ACP methyl ester carboxylesterase
MNKQKPFIILLLALLLCACSNPQTLEQTESKFVTADGVKIHYKTAGKGGQCIVFVHGFGCDVNSWSEQFTHFSEKAKTVFIDLPGYGMSDKPHTEYTLNLFADAVKAVMDEENISRAVLVGHSLGTPVCRQLAFSHPNLVSEIVDVDGVYCFYPADSAMLSAYKTFAESFNNDSVKQTIEGFVKSLCTPLTPRSVRDYAMKTMPLTPRYIAYSTMKNLIEEKYWMNGKISVPVLVIASKNSQIPPDYKQIMKGLYTNMEYHELDSIGHFIMMEKPRMFNNLLDEFINKD